MYGRLRVAVVIPAHQEAQLLPGTLAGLPDYVDRILVIDDASTDGTASLAEECGDSRVKVIRHERNRGVGAAIVTGYRHARTYGADATVVVGADAQMDPSEMSSLLEPLLEDEADYVKGDRLGHPELRERMPSIRLFGNRVLTVLTRLTSGYRQIRDSQCGYTAISLSALNALDLDDLYPRYGFPNDLLAKLAELRLRVEDHPVTPIYGNERSGIRVRRVIMPILWLLLRSGLRRVLRQHTRAHRKPTKIAAATSTRPRPHSQSTLS